MSVRELRQITNQLIERKHEIVGLINQISEIKVNLDERMLKVCRYEGNYGDNGYYTPESVDSAFDTDIPVLGSVFINVLTGDQSQANNISIGIRKIAELAEEKNLVNNNGQEPNLEGWSENEIVEIEEIFAKKINGINNEIRKISMFTQVILNAEVFVDQAGDLFQCEKLGMVALIQQEFLGSRIGNQKAEQIISLLNKIKEVSELRYDEEPHIMYEKYDFQDVRLPLPSLREAVYDNKIQP